VTRGFMGPLGGFWPKLGRKRVTGWKQRSCVPPGRVKTNKQTNQFSSFYGKNIFFPSKTSSETYETKKNKKKFDVKARTTVACNDVKNHEN
jgi:hypothetical protein